MNKVFDAAEAFERLWASGSSPDLEVFLRDMGAVATNELSRLARIDQGERWRLCDRHLAEEYLDRFPVLTADDESAVDLIYHEYLLREELAEHPALEEFTKRFPQHAQALTSQIALHRALADSADANSSIGNAREKSTHTSRVTNPLLSKLPTQFGRYWVLHVLGRGGMGCVYEAEDTQLGRRVALKLPNVDREESQEALELFRREARIAATFHHPNLCPIYDFGELDGTLYLTMPYLSGQPLSARLSSGPLPEQEAAQIALKVAGAMSVAHEAGIVHRDLKPSNIMLREDGDPVVMDFGLARRDIRPDPQLASSGSVVGTLAYMAPELLGSTGLAARPVSDVYSLGVILFEMLTGRLPFTGSWGEFRRNIHSDPAPSPSHFAPGLSPQLNEVCEKAMAKDSQARFTSMAALVAALAPIVGQQTAIHEHDAAISLEQRRMRPSTVAALIAAVLGAALSWGVWHAVNVRWARQQIAAIENLSKTGRSFDAYNLGVRARDYLPSEPKLTRMMTLLSDGLTVTSKPTGAQVYLRRFGANSPRVESQREYVGKTPLADLEVARGEYIVSIEKEGYVPFQRSWSGAARGPVSSPLVLPSPAINVALTPVADVHPRMTVVPGGSYRLGGWKRPTDATATLDDYVIDKFEVTNREYQGFVDAGGYLDDRFWTQRFVKDGRELSREEAMRELRDSTGLAGPRNWSDGNYPKGKADHPVTGITWYEAAAYAAYRGKSLPTIFQWEKAARFQWELPGYVGPNTVLGVTMPWGLLRQGSTSGRANFASNGAVPVGSLEFGMSPFGCYEMAGNVSEWCLNETSAGHIACGGSWGSRAYEFGACGLYPSFYHSDQLGFRCVLNSGAATGDQGAMRIDVDEEPFQFTPEPAAKVQTWMTHYEYKKSPLEARVVGVEETSDWRREKIEYNGAGGERALAYLYLPRQIPGPHQVIHFFPPGDVTFGIRTVPQSIEADYAQFVRSGRAIFAVVLKGYLEREGTSLLELPDADKIEYVEAVARHIVDLRRGVDYLESRDDVDPGRIVFMGASMGGIIMCLPAIEPRYSAVIFCCSVLRKADSQIHFAANPFNYVPLIKQPKLLVHGRYDETSPLRTDAEPLHRLIPEPRLVRLFDGGHCPNPEWFAQESSAFLDRTLGPVNSK